jgi:hypothetical protein
VTNTENTTVKRKLSAKAIEALGKLMSAPRNRLHGKDGWVNGNVWNAMLTNGLVAWDKPARETVLMEKGRQAFAVGYFMAERHCARCGDTDDLTMSGGLTVCWPCRCQAEGLCTTCRGERDVPWQDGSSKRAPCDDCNVGKESR